MDWLLAAPFIESSSDRWLGQFVPGERHCFHPVPAGYRHDRSRGRTSAGQWMDYFRHASDVWSQLGGLHRRERSAGVVSVFPQLAIALGLRKRLTARPVPLVAWTFNLGKLHGGPKKTLARMGLASVDRFIVHSRREIESYSAWLDLPRERFRFVPLQRFVRPVELGEDNARPFVLAMGTAQRDYRLFLSVVGELAYPTVVVAGASALEGLTIPPNVKIFNNLDIQQCRVLVQRARVNVVPIANEITASGQVTLIDSMMYGRATVATRTVGTEDYAEDGKTAALVAPGDYSAMKLAIARLWEDADGRRRLGIAARAYAQDHFSDESIGRTLGQVLDEFVVESGR